MAVLLMPIECHQVVVAPHNCWSLAVLWRFPSDEGLLKKEIGTKFPSFLLVLWGS